MKVFRCKICGDPYLGEDVPTNCPFCGAPSKYMVMAGYWEEPVIESLSEEAKDNLYSALQLEVDNIRFYKCATEMTNDKEGKQMFRALSKIESEHASLIAKILGIEKPTVTLDKIACYPSYQENLKDAHAREERAIKEYSKFFKAAKEPRIKEIFQALVQIESDHLRLAEERIKK
ncbi:MAG: ferritin-like domain-containing protein [Methanomassiliicoccales archaeon]|nr:MAG: ferritin-like domain-containing protein [Methanomassiliicoccales archaeon]